MIELRGKYNTAKVFTDNVEATAQGQIIELCNQEFVKDSKIRIMPDCHAGAGCTIGTTMTIQDKIVPNLVGVDIGCGVYVVRLISKNLDLKNLDEVISQYVPSGFDVRKDEHQYNKYIDLDKLKCKKEVNIERAKLSIGTLGGGNHYLEVDKDDNDFLYLCIHSGSRNLGKQVAEYYQDLAYSELTHKVEITQDIIEKLKREGRQKDIQKELKKMILPVVNKQLAYLCGNSFNDYLHDMRLVQQFATWNRKAIACEILHGMKIYGIKNEFETIHNYINTDSMILRKGAVSATTNEELIIPINMRDGSLICIGKGNADWNFSAPHGAGRLMSRSQAKVNVTMEEYTESMKGIYTTSVSQSTLDESPMAYKPMQEIIDNIKDTVDITKIIKPIYNFKAGE